jgi:hypothetical protein
MTLKFNPFTNRLDITETGGSGGGDVNGPGSSTDNAIVRWNGVSGTLIQNSVATLSDTGDIIANSIDLTVPLDELDGGTAQSSYTTGDILYASGVNTLAKLAAGSDGQVLTLAAGIPSWAASAGGGVTSVSGTANRITSTGGATPVIDISGSYVGQASITTLGTIATGVWTGTTIAVANGGTGATTLTGVLTGNGTGAITANAITQYGVLIGGASNAVGSTAVGSAGQVLQSSGAGVNPAYSTATYPTTATGTGTILRADGTNWVATTSTYPTTNAVSTLLYASASNVMSALATANNGTLVTSNTGVPSILAGPGTTGNILQSNAAAAPSFSTATFPSTATGTGTVLRADGTNWVASTATYPNTATTGDLIYGSASNVYSNLAINAYKGVPVAVGASGIPVYLSPVNYHHYFYDFIGGANNQDVWTSGVINSGSVDWQVPLTNAHPGVVRVTTGNSSASGGAGLNMSSNSGTIGPYICGGGEATFTWYCALSALSDGTDTYTSYMGLSDVNSTFTTFNNGMWFQYTHGTNSGNYQIVCANGGATTTNNSSTAADTSYHRFKIVVNAGATSVSFFIDDSEVANSPISTNITTVSTGIKPFICILKSVGTARRQVNVDYYTSFINLTTAR